MNRKINKKVVRQQALQRGVLKSEDYSFGDGVDEGKGLGHSVQAELVALGLQGHQAFRA